MLRVALRKFSDLSEINSEGPFCVIQKRFSLTEIIQNTKIGGKRFFFENNIFQKNHGAEKLRRDSSSSLNEVNTEAKRCFATHDEDIDYFNMRIYYFNRMRIYSTFQLCSITSLWHSGQHLCRAIGRLQVRISLGFWLLSKRRSL